MLAFFFHRIPLGIVVHPQTHSVLAPFESFEINFILQGSLSVHDMIVELGKVQIQGIWVVQYHRYRPLDTGAVIFQLTGGFAWINWLE